MHRKRTCQSGRPQYGMSFCFLKLCGEKYVLREQGLGKKCVLGGTGVGGNGGKVLVRDQLGLMAQTAATVAPVLVTAAAPRDLRVDPCEGKSKRDEFSRMRQRSVAVVVLGVSLVNMTVATFYSGNEAAKFAKICTSG